MAQLNALDTGDDDDDDDGEDYFNGGAKNRCVLYSSTDFEVTALSPSNALLLPFYCLNSYYFGLF